MLIEIEPDEDEIVPSYTSEDERIQAQATMKIGVFRALQLGDLLCCIPALRALRNCYPRAEITLFGLPWAQQFVTRFPEYFNHFKHFPGYPGLPEQQYDLKAITKFISWAQNEQFDLILQMQGNGTLVNPLMMLLGGKFTAGFFTKGHFYPNNGLFLEYPEEVHEVERHLLLMKHVGVEAQGNWLEFPLYDKDWEALRQLHLPLSHQDYVCIHAGSRGSWRQWPPEYFALLGDYCITQNLQVVLTGTTEELPVVNQVKKLMQRPPIVVAGKTSLGAVGALIKNAFALVSNCTGVSHIAAALQTPSVVISMDGEPERWAPFNKALHHTIDWTETPDFEVVLAALQQIFSNQMQDSPGGIQPAV